MAIAADVRGFGERFRARTGSDWIEGAARVGYAALAVVYTILGVLILRGAAGAAGGAAGTGDVLTELGKQPFGAVLLMILAGGLACFVFWRGVQTVLGARSGAGDSREI